MSEDPRCCGSGHCIIDDQGRCWCGQQWDGTRMCHPPLPAQQTPEPSGAGSPVDGDTAAAP